MILWFSLVTLTADSASIVLTYFLESDLVCRHWVEQVSKIKREYSDGTIKHTKKDRTNKACYNKKEDKWYFENYNDE